MVTVRTIQERDTEAFLALSTRLDEETDFRLLEAGERRTTVEEQRETIERARSTDNQTMGRRSHPWSLNSTADLWATSPVLEGGTGETGTVPP